jgi:hypothetical protein
MYTEYSKVLNFFRAQASYAPNTDLRDILWEFAEIKKRPDDLAAARFLIGKYHQYNELLANSAYVI